MLEEARFLPLAASMLLLFATTTQDSTRLTHIEFRQVRMLGLEHRYCMHVTGRK